MSSALCGAAPVDLRRGRVTLRSVSLHRICSKPSCRERAVATLTFVYSDSTVVLGPLATTADPYCHDLCQGHADRLTVPRGWDVIRLDFDPAQFGPTLDDLETLADAVREAGRSKAVDPLAVGEADVPAGTVEGARRGHLRVLRTTD